MSMFGELTAGYIREAIEKEIKDTKISQATSLDFGTYWSGVLHGLELAKTIAEKYED